MVVTVPPLEFRACDFSGFGELHCAGKMRPSHETDSDDSDPDHRLLPQVNTRLQKLGGSIRVHFGKCKRNELLKTQAANPC